jgi:protein-S-isoprenylcysteine O-methyltransferase Ste14
MTIPLLATAIRLLWILIEYPYLSRHRIKPARDWDRHSAKLWDAANLIEPIGMLIGFTSIGRFQTGTNIIGSVGLTLLMAGIIIRWTAIRTLGKYFTSTVLIKNDHRLIRTGLYRHLRHPAYAGALLAHLGLGLSFSNWFSLGFSSIPYLVAALYRMRVEERALKEAFGAEYLDYSKTVKRLIPRLY